MNFEYNITTRKKDGGWQYIISYKDQNGKWRQKSKQGFKREREAKIAADKRLDELKEPFEMKLVEGHDKVTFKQFKNIFLKAKDLHLEGNTIENYKKAFKKFSELDSMILEDIGFAHVQNCVNEMIKEGLNINTIQMYLNKIKTLFKAAVKPFRIIREGPDIDEIMLPKPKIKKHEVKALTAAELSELLSKIRPEKDYIICLLASYCGLRIGEIIGLCTPDINLKNCTVNVNKQWKKLKDGKWDFGNVKSKNSNRVVPIPTKIISSLSNYLNSGVRNIDKRLFSEKSTVNVSSRLRLKFRRLGFNNSIHDLRHTYATRLIAAGMDFKTVAELMGDTVETIIKTYSHFTEDMANAAAKRVNQIFL